MKALKLFSLTVSISFICLAFTFKTINTQEDLADCVKKYNSKWGLYCSLCGDLSSGSYTVYLRNECKEKVDVKCAVQEKNKTWRTFVHSSVAPKDTVAVYACNGTGKYLKWVRSAGDVTTEFPTDKQINEEFK